MSSRTFHRKVITVEILSETPIPDVDDLTEIAWGITDGDWSGLVSTGADEQVDGRHMAALLTAQGSDPEFFGLDEHGNDIKKA